MLRPELDDLLINNPKVDGAAVREICEVLEETGYTPKSRYRIAHPFGRLVHISISRKSGLN